MKIKLATFIGLLTLTSLLPLPGQAAGSKQRLSRCGSSSCLYHQIVVKANAAYTNKDCKVLDKRTVKHPVPENLGKLCRIYIARLKASLRKDNACLKKRLLTPDYMRNIPEHEVWVYSDALFARHGLVIDQVKSLENARFKVQTVHNINVLKRVVDFNVPKVVDYTWRKRKRQKKMTINRSLGFDVYYCITGSTGHYRYVPYYYVLRATQDYQPEYQAPTRKKRRRRLSKEQKAKLAKEQATERERLAKLHEQRSRFSTLQAKYVKKLPEDAARILAQLNDPRLKSRYRNYQLLDFNGDGKSDLVFLEDGFNKFRPGVCIYQPKKEACKLVMPKRFVTATYFNYKTEMKPRPKKGIDLVISDGNYDDQQVKFEYVFEKGLLARNLSDAEKEALKEAKERTRAEDRRKARGDKSESRKKEKTASVAKTKAKAKSRAKKKSRKKRKRRSRKRRRAKRQG